MIDIHTHLWNWKDTPAYIEEYLTSRGYFGDKDGATFFSTKALLNAMDEAQIETSVVHPLRSESVQWIVSNEFIADVVKEAPDRLIGFAGVTPYSTDAVPELKHAIEDLGLRGLKLHPPMQMFNPGDALNFPVYEQMQSYGLPILFHTGSGPTQMSDRYSNPHLLDEVAVHFPNLKIMMAHAGRFWYQETLTMMRRHPNIYVDISATVGKATGYGLLLFLLVAMKEVVGNVDRVLFASDYPWYQPKQMLDLLKGAQEASKALPEPLHITDEDIRKITDTNARKVLNLK